MKPKDPVQESSIGAQLRQGREAKGWVLKEAARRTKLRLDHLEKLERDEFELLPSMAYARGFVRIYARELELDGWKLLRQFDGEVEESIDMLELQTEDFEAIPERSTMPRITFQSFGLLLSGLVLVFALVVAGMHLHRVWQAGESASTAPQTILIEEQRVLTEADQNAPPRATPLEGQASPPTSPRALPVEPSAPRAVPVEEVISAPRAMPVDGAPPRALPLQEEQPQQVAEGLHRLQLRAETNAAEGERWVRVVAVRGENEEILFEDLLPPGMTIPATDADAWRADVFVITFREASAVDIIFNGRNSGKYDLPGVQRVRIPGS